MGAARAQQVVQHACICGAHCMRDEIIVLAKSKKGHSMDTTLSFEDGYLHWALSLEAHVALFRRYEST